MNVQKVQKLRVNIIYWSLNFPKLISMCLKDNTQNQTISELYTDDRKTKYFSNPNDILKSAKNVYEKLYTKRQSPKLPFLTF